MLKRMFEREEYRVPNVTKINIVLLTRANFSQNNRVSSKQIARAREDILSIYHAYTLVA